MAAAPWFMSRISEQRTNGAKLSRLIFDEGTVALRSLFDRYHPPASLVADLRSNYKTLLPLLEKKLINQTQWELLFPTDASLPCSRNMDIHLLFLFLHNICGLIEPISGWNSPSSSDNSLEGNVARLKWYINEVAERVSSAGVQTTQFNFYWDEITTALKSLGVYNSTSEELKTKPLNEADANTYYMLLVNWAARDKAMQHQLQRIDSASEKKKQMLSSMQQVQEETLKAMQDLTIHKMPFTWIRSSIIGRGCKGTRVCRGQLTSNGKAVAVKKMYSGVFDMKEAEKLRRCQHPNIIRCFDTYEEEDFFYIALELCEKTLRECIDDDEFTSVNTSRGKCLLQVTSGVVYLHEKKICHRDIKPDNILLTIRNNEYTHRRFVLADFNCARDVPSGESFSTQHSTVGTAGWMAPEAHEAGQRRTLKVDVFSLGCVFHYTLTNKKHPFGDINNGDKCQAAINTSKDQPTLNRDDFVENVCLCDLIGRMVNPDQQRRPESSEVHNHLVLKLANENEYNPAQVVSGQLQFRQVVPQQVPGQFASMPSPAFSQQQSPYGMPQTTLYTQPQQPFYIFKTPKTPVSLPQQQPPRPPEQKRERKIIQIRDPNQDNRDITQEILMSVAHSGSGTPNSTPDASGRSSNSNTPPVNSHIDAGAQFAAQVAATLANDKPSSNKSSPQTSKPASPAVTTEVAVPLQYNESKLVETSRGSVVAVKQLKRSENAWVRLERQERESSDQAKTEGLYHKVTSILNQLTLQTFQTLMNQILELEIDTPERLEGVIDKIFEKAISEPGFNVAYANMCRCLMAIKVNVQIKGKDGKEAHVSLRKILLNKCQKEFEKEKSEENLVHAKMDALAQQGLKEDELKMKKAELEVEEINMRRRSLGNIRFIGELFKLKMLTENIMHDCVVKLLRSTDEGSYECLCKLLTTIGKDLDHEKAKPRVDQYFDQIYKIVQSRRTSSRVRFMMIDVVDLRKSNWVPRREDNNP